MVNQKTNPIPFRKQEPIIEEILKAVKVDKAEHPLPDHMVARSTYMFEPTGELMIAALILKYRTPETAEDYEAQVKVLRDLAIRSAARAIRFIESLNHHSFYHLTQIQNDTRNTESIENPVSQDPEREG